MASYKPEDPNYIRIPEFGVDDYQRRIWTVKVKKDGVWAGKKFFSYEEAYKYYVQQLAVLRNYIKQNSK